MAILKIDLPYGDRYLSVDIPDERLLFVARPNDLPAAPDEYEEITRSIRNPIGKPGLAQLAKGKRKTIIVADDLTRVTPCRKIVPLLLNELNACGMSDENITLMIALGTHRLMTDTEITERFGKEVVQRVSVVNHDWQDKDKLVYAGDTASGIPVWINKLFYEADFRIGIGNVQPHEFAGWGGGGKIVQPGICGEETTSRTHLMAGHYRPDQVLGDPESPIRIEIEETARKADLGFVINTVLNSKRQIVKVYSGHPVEAHREAVKLAKQIYCPEIPKPADILIATSYPADIDYWQASKAAAAAYLGVRQGGVIILATPCREGIAAYHPDVEKYGTLNSKQVEKMIKEKTIDIVAAGFLLNHIDILNKADMIFVSDCLTDTMCGHINCRKARTVDEAMRLSEKKVGSNASIGFMLYADMVLRTET